MARQRGRLEALHSIWPDLQMLKQLGLEVQNTEVYMNQFEKALKGLQRELDLEEGEHRLSSSCSLTMTSLPPPPLDLPPHSSTLPSSSSFLASVWALL